MEKTIRIAQIMGKWLGGGVESVVMNYYRHIDRTKIQFDFICDNDSTNIPYDEIESLGGRVILIPPYQKVFKYHKELKRILKEGNYKIVHSHINTLSVFSLFAAKCASVPVRIAHSHSTTNKKEKKKNLLKQVLRPFSKMFATDYMCCSELAGRWLFGDKEYNKGNVYLLNNAIDLDKFKYDSKVRKDVRKELDISDDTIVIGHVGRFVEQKNHRFLIDIFNDLHKKNSNSVLILAGHGPLMDEIKDKVDDLGIADSVLFLGQRSDVNRLYQAFDVFLLPSLYEGLPVVAVEAQASGLLCFLSNDMTKETKVLDSAVFMSLDNSSSEWADCILKKYKDFKRIDTRCEISNNGFDIIKEASKLENEYIKLQKITVVHIINSNIFSGLESVACDIIEGTKDICNGIYVTQDGPIVDILIEKNIPYYLIKKMSVYELKKMNKKLKPDIIHAHDFTASCVCAFSFFNKKIISHLHNNCPWLKEYCVYSILYLLCSFKFKVILIVSKSIQDEYIFSKLIKSKIKCIKNPISCKKILSLVELKDHEKKYDICCVARLTEQKNPKKFIDLIENLKKDIPYIKCIWVGDGELMSECEKIVSEKGLNKNIEFLGFKKNPYTYMALSRIFVLTSDWEGYGLVAFEAMTLGVPCVVSNVGGLPTIVDKDTGFLCESVSEFYDCCCTLLHDEKKLKKYSNNSVKKANKIENIDKYLFDLRNIYMEISVS